MSDAVEQLTLFDLDTWSGKCARSFSSAGGEDFRVVLEEIVRIKARTGAVPRPDSGRGNLLGQSYWEINSHWLGELWTLNTGVSPSAAKESSLSQILQGEVPHKYYLSRTACLGILRRAKARGKELPPQLKRALEIQAEAGRKNRWI